MSGLEIPSIEVLLGPSADITDDPVAGWRHALACGLYDARCLLPPSAIDNVVDTTVAVAVDLGLIEHVAKDEDR